MSQAYEILSDPEKRKVYDQYGLEFLLHGGAQAPPPGAGGSGANPFEAGGFPGFGNLGGGGGTRTFHFTTGSGGRGGFTFSNPESIFSEFIRGGGADDDDIFARLGGMGGGPRSGFQTRSSRHGEGGAGASGKGGMPPPEVEVVEKPLNVSLEELFRGTRKKMKIKRKLYDPATKRQTAQDKILEMDIKPGLKAGSKIKFKDVGDQFEGGTQDLHFIVQEVPLSHLIFHVPLSLRTSLTDLTMSQKEHPIFERDGDDLRATVDIDLKEALTGWRRTVSTIEGRQLPVSGAGPTPPGFEERFPNMGMPKSKRPQERGDLIVQVNVKFPATLTASQKAKLKEIL